MPYRRRNSVAGLAFGLSLVLLMAAACGEELKTESRESTVEKNRSLLDYVPDNTYLSLGFVDVDSLAAQPWSQDLVSLTPALELWDKKLGITIDQFHRIAMAVEFPQDLTREPDALMILSSDLGEEQILAMIGDKSRYFEQTRIAGMTRYSSGAEFSFAVLDPGVVAIGAPSLVTKAMQLRGGSGKKVLSGKNIERFENYLGERDNIWFGIGGLDKLIGQLSKDNIYLKNYATIEFVYFGLTAGDGLGGRLVLECADEKDAGKLARGISGMIGILSTLVDFEGLDVQSESIDIPLDELKRHMETFFSSINVEQQAKNVLITYTVPQQMVDFFLEMGRQSIKRQRSGDRLPDSMDEPEISELPDIEQQQ